MKPTRVLKSRPINYFDQFYNDLFDFKFPFKSEFESFHPSVNIKENNDAYIIEMALAGFDKDKIDIDIIDKNLIVSAQVEHSVENENEDGEYRLREFSTRSFKRSFHLGDKVDTSNISAKFENGILFLTLEKKAEEKTQPARRIDIM